MSTSHDQIHYILWRKTRIAKLEQLFGKEFFRNKRVLECGAGTGLIGKTLHNDYGANVSFTEGRSVFIPEIRKNNPDAAIHCINHEKSWYLGEYDFIIHWGLLYHLDNWKNDLLSVFNSLPSGGILSIETEILDYDHIDEVKKPEPVGDDQALDGQGTQMTASAVEAEFDKLGFTYKRYDDTDLNAEFHHYDWIVKNSGKFTSGQRRFWICTKP